MDLDIVWTQGRCHGDAYFISENSICFRSGSFIKICSTNEFSEDSIQGPFGNIECLCGDHELGLIALSSQNSYIYIIAYPSFDVKEHWKVNKRSNFIQLCFTGNDYLLTLETSPNFGMTLWNWKKAVMLANVEHNFPTECISDCYISIHPNFRKLSVFQQVNCLHFYEIDDICQKVNFERKTIYIPILGDKSGKSILDEKDIKTLTYFDKIQHDSWGIDSELLHKFPLSVFSSDLSEREVIELYDFLTKEERLKASCHCWLPDRNLVVACFNGTILLASYVKLSIRIIHSPSESQSITNFVTCMALNANGLFVCMKNGDVFMVQNIDQWILNKKFSIEENPLKMKFSPDYRNLLFANKNGSVIFLEINDDKNNGKYLTYSIDDSRVVGIFSASSEFCLTARVSGIIEAWELNTGTLVSCFDIHESIECMEGCPSSSMLLLSASSTYFYAVSFGLIKEIKIVHVSRPSGKAIGVIKCEPYGRFAILASCDSYAFVYGILPSKDLKSLGYVRLQYDITDIAVHSKDVQDETYVALLVKNSSTSHVICFQVPGDFDCAFENFWEDKSGLINTTLLKLVDINLDSYCCSVVAHHLHGLILCLPKEKTMLRIPFESISEASLKTTEKLCNIVEDFEACRMLLSSSHGLLLILNSLGDVCIRNTNDFREVFHKKNFDFRFESCIDFTRDMIFIEGLHGVLICFKLIGHIEKTVKMPWTFFLEDRKPVEDEALSRLEPQSKTELLPWVQKQLLFLNEDVLLELKTKQQELETKFCEIEMQLGVLARENFSMPLEHQIESKEFILDEEIKEELLKSREECVENFISSLQEKLDAIEKDLFDIRQECVENMAVKGKILKSFRQASSLHNYSIPTISVYDKTRIAYSYKKMQLEYYLKHLKTNKEVEQGLYDEELTYDKAPADSDKENIGKSLRKQPFQLQSLEERMDYVYILKYIILKKRLAFNRLFDDIAMLRKNTVQNIEENNSRIKEVLLMLGEERNIWEPIDDSDTLLQVTSEEIKNASKLLLEKCSKEPKGLAEEFLSDEWLVKRKAALTQKYQIRLKKDNIDRLKKEIEKKFKTIDGLVNHYERVHSDMIQEKLLWDLDINQDELQLFLLLFSTGNFRNFKRWEIFNQRFIGELEGMCKDYSARIKELETVLSKAERETETLESESSVLDQKVEHISKMSRNKQAFLEAYDQRPEILEETSLNPYKNIDAKENSPENALQELNANKYKPKRVPLSLWKQLCSLRERKFSLEKDIDKSMSQTDFYKKHLDKLKSHLSQTRQTIKEEKENLQNIHEMRVICNFETPMVLSVSNSQLEMKYPDDLDFRHALFLRKFHVDGLNNMITNAGSAKLQAVEHIAKAEYQIEKNECKVRLDKLDLRDLEKEIEIIKSIPLTKDVQKIIQDPKGFSLQDKIDALEKSKQMEMDDITKQMNQVKERVSNIEVKKDILRKSVNEKKREIQRLKGDISELYKIEKLKNTQKMNL